MKMSSLLGSVLLAGISLNTAHAIDLRDGFGGRAGYGELSQPPNDDDSSSQLNLPFSLNFFGNTYSTFWQNNNGNITFGGPVDEYTPKAFPVSGQPMIAPFWADVDTSGTGAVYTASPDANTLVATWHDVGYFDAHSNKTNDFQLTLLNRPDTGAGNFDIEFRYRQLQWTTGDYSFGYGGLGGIPAQAGYDAGNGTNFFALPGSFGYSVLDLATTSNVSQNTPGLWTMAIRNGHISDGSSPAAPLLPNIVEQDGWHFNFNIQLNQHVYVDPPVAIGYDFTITSGPNIESAVFPILPGDTNGYDIYGFDNATHGYGIIGHVNGGVVFTFGNGGVSEFGVRGIDMAAGLDPANTHAFVTGLTFVSAGDVSLIQTPISVVPEPETCAMLLAGLGLVSLIARRRKPLA